MKKQYRDSFDMIKISENFEEKVIEKCERNKKAKIKKIGAKKIVAVTSAVVLAASFAGFTVSAAGNDFSQQVKNFFIGEDINNASDEESIENSESGMAESIDDFDYNLIAPYVKPLDMSYDAKNANITLTGTVSDGSSVFVFGEINVFDENFVFDEDMCLLENLSFESIEDGTWATGGDNIYPDNEIKNKAYFVVSLQTTGRNISKVDFTVKALYEGNYDKDSYLISLWHEFKDIDIDNNIEPLNLINNSNAIKIKGYKIQDEEHKTKVEANLSNVNITPFGVQYSYENNNTYYENGIYYYYSFFEPDDNLIAVMKDGSKKDISFSNVEDRTGKNGRYMPIVLDLSQVDYIEHTDELNGTIKIDVAGKYAEKYGETTESTEITSDTEESTNNTETTGETVLSETTEISTDISETESIEKISD